MNQITIVYMGSEVAYGEGETVGWAWEEAKENLPSEYKAVEDDISIIWLAGDKRRVYTWWEALATFC
jgi:hypothetical protein